MNKDMNKKWLATGGVMCLIAVAAGAFGAHGLRHILQPAQLANFETGVRYLMFHGLALAALGGRTGPWHSGLMNKALGMLAFGAIFFALCLTIYVMAGWRPAAMLVPIGGTAMILGWGMMLTALGLGPQSETAQ